MSNNSTEIYNQISRFLNDEMEAKEKVAFEKELENNDILHHEFMKVITQTFEKKRILVNVNKLGKKYPAKTSKTINFNSTWVKVAAIIIIAIVVGGIVLLNTNTKPETLLISENLNYSSPYVFRNGESNEEDMKLNAHWYFTEEEYGRSAELLKEIVKSNPTDEESKFYLGLSLLSSKENANVSQSIRLFQDLLNSNRFGPQSHWFLALALYESGQPEQAEVYFQKIINEGWSFKDKANKILTEAY